MDSDVLAKLKGIRPVWLITGTAALGFVGYRWIASRRAATAAAAPQIDPSTGLPIDPMTGLDVGSGGSTAEGYVNPSPAGAVNTVNSTAPSTAPSTNQEWVTAGVNFMSGFGYDPQVVLPALSAYLANQAVTTTQAGYIHEVIAGVGKEPIGTHSIRTTPAPPTPAPKPVTPPIPKAPPTTRKPPPPVAHRGAHTYTVHSGDTLAGIAAKTGHHLSAATIYTQNRATIEAAARTHGRASSSAGHWIYPGTVLALTY